MIACKKCNITYDDNEIGADDIKNFESCYLCIRQMKHSQVLNEIASALKSGESYVFDGYATDLVPVGNMVYKTKIFINEDGFGFGEESASREQDSEFFEWGSQLYIGPKSYNRFESLRRYREICEAWGVDDQSKRALEDMEDWQKEFELHFLAEQKIGFVVTAGSTTQNTIDRWVSLYLGSRPDFSIDAPKVPYTGFWHVHELNDLFKNFQFRGWTDEDDNPISMPKGVSEYLEAEALRVQNTDRSAYSNQKSGYGYNEAEPLTETFEP
jgi:hypothetical protein